MSDFKLYLENVNYFAIVDLIIVVLAIVLIAIFFKKRNSIRLALLFMLYLVLFTAVSVICAFTESRLLFISVFVLKGVGTFFMLCFAVVFQTDLKIIFSKLGKHQKKSDKFNINSTEDELRKSAKEIVKACQSMSKNDIGALILIAPNNPPPHILETGTYIGGTVSSSLIETIFNTKAVLHDGAVVIKGNCILGAGCFLPLTTQSTVSKDLGTRHRAAIGITEESDVLAIVVSEETGIISSVYKGEIKRYLTPDKLNEIIETIYGVYVNNNINQKSGTTIIKNNNINQKSGTTNYKE